MRPDNVELIRAHRRAYKARPHEQALSEARSALSIGQRDAQFREMWLHLEAWWATSERLRATPDHRRERTREPALSTLLIGLADLRKFDEAQPTRCRSLDERASPAGRPRRPLALDRNDLQKAINVFSEFIASPANDLNDPSAYLAFGDFLIQRGTVEQGITTLRRAQSVQSKESPIADAILSDKLFETAGTRKPSPCSSRSSRPTSRRTPPGAG